MLAVILAAGRGSRLAEITKEKPKCLVELDGKSIIERQIEAIRFNGIDEIYVVAGYKAEMVKRAVDGMAKIILNEEYASTDNIYSLYLAKRWSYGKEFVLMNGDVVFDEIVLKSIIKNGNLIALSKKYDREALKVKINNGRVIKILPKSTPENECDASISGIFKFSPHGSKLLFDEIEKNVAHGVRNRWFEHALNEVLEKDEFTPVYVDDYRCIEIDTIEDLRKAKEMWG